jgi:hypothetical protein
MTYDNMARFDVARRSKSVKLSRIGCRSGRGVIFFTAVQGAMGFPGWKAFGNAAGDELGAGCRTVPMFSVIKSTAWGWSMRWGSVDCAAGAAGGGE